MNESHVALIAAELNIKPAQVTNTVKLLKEDATVPFIARYRKEMTESLDEVAITAVRDRLHQLEELDARREAIIASLTERELLTDELRTAVEAAQTMAVLEDIYLPFRPKRRTRATIAREKGLEPLAQAILAQTGINPETEAAQYVDAEKGVADAAEALAGARDIIAEIVNEQAAARARMRELFLAKGEIVSKLSGTDETAAAKYRDYFDWKEAVTNSPSHRILAMFRGEREHHLAVKIAPQQPEALAILESLFITGAGADSDQVREAVQDAYSRLLAPSMENEVRAELKHRADDVAIRVFADNLRQLLMAPPLGGKRVMAVDPGYRTGCKIACIDAQGTILEHDTIYLAASEEKIRQGAEKVRGLIAKHAIEAVAIGNGTASRESDAFFHALGLDPAIIIVMVNESGASVYSASDVAREEFPKLDVTVRGAISIGRRLMDPLAELVKIDPKSIGVGQYQHDVDQGRLKQSLDDVVVSCVNGVGVDLNTASPQLLSYVSGLGQSLARAVVKFREENGAFRARIELHKVPRLGPKAFEQAAGFLRIREGENPLDASAVHPESYPIVERMAADLGVSLAELIGDAELRAKVDLNRYCTETVGIPTLQDILEELAKPGRDPRKEFEQFSFTAGIEKITDLQVGQKLPGIVTNITDFGAFVDVGVHQDGLVHVSQLADRFIKNPHEVVKVGQQVQVTVIEVDVARTRISLSLKADPFKKPEPRAPRPRRESHPHRPAGEKKDRPGATAAPEGRPEAATGAESKPAAQERRRPPRKPERRPERRQEQRLERRDKPESREQDKTKKFSNSPFDVLAALKGKK